MKTRALAFALLGWFFMFRVPHPELKGIKVSVLVGIFETEKECSAEFDKVSDEIDGLPGVVLSECEFTEEI